MSYVDLNPIRAGSAKDLTASAHTSAARRMTAIHHGQSQATIDLRALRSSVVTTPLSLKTSAYLELIDWTARQLRPDKRGAMDATPPILAKLDLRDRQWQYQVPSIESRYYRAIGCANVLIDKAKSMGQSWLKGLGTAQRMVRHTL